MKVTSEGFDENDEGRDGRGLNPTRHENSRGVPNLLEGDPPVPSLRLQICGLFSVLESSPEINGMKHINTHF